MARRRIAHRGFRCPFRRQPGCPPPRPPALPSFSVSLRVSSCANQHIACVCHAALLFDRQPSFARPLIDLHPLCELTRSMDLGGEEHMQPQRPSIVIHGQCKQLYVVRSWSQPRHVAPGLKLIPSIACQPLLLRIWKPLTYGFLLLVDC
jgi:hypothetical protein